ncbi:MAG TPA: hypothetical protein GX714_11840 [Chloroflexi bacterium]|nr:hypothetical protein [Chloroflexota bacterium]
MGAGAIRAAVPDGEKRAHPRQDMTNYGDWGEGDVATSTTARKSYYFTTRDLLIMAVLAGLGGVASTAINALGDVMQAVLGFAGTTQWAAGLHVTFLLLAVGLTRKDGAGTVTGCLKGGVELLSGNTHGVIVLLVDVAAGLLVDWVFFLIRDQGRASRWGHALAGGVAAASNVFVFQLFASAPEDVLAFVWGIAAVAFVSGAVLGGLLSHALLIVLHRNGLVRATSPARVNRAGTALALGVLAAAAIGGGVFLRSSLAGPPVVAITGACAVPYEYEAATTEAEITTLELELQGMKRRVTGVRLRDIISAAGPDAAAQSVLVSANDGYAFFITMREVAENDNLVLAHRGEGKETSYDVAGAENPKAWVRNVVELRLVPQALIEVSGKVERPFPYNPEDWQTAMDNARLDLGDGVKKLQGAVLRDVLAKWEPAADATALRLVSRGGETATIPLAEVMANGDLRIWNVDAPEGISFAVATADGTIHALDVVTIIVE